MLYHDQRPGLKIHWLHRGLLSVDILDLELLDVESVTRR